MRRKEDPSDHECTAPPNAIWGGFMHRQPTDIKKRQTTVDENTARDMGSRDAIPSTHSPYKWPPIVRREAFVRRVGAHQGPKETTKIDIWCEHAQKHALNPNMLRWYNTMVYMNSPLACHCKIDKKN